MRIFGRFFLSNTKEVIEGLKDEKHHIRLAALNALQKKGSEARVAKPILFKILEDKNEDEFLRMAVAMLLIEIEPTKGVFKRIWRVVGEGVSESFSQGIALKVAAHGYAGLLLNAVEEDKKKAKEKPKEQRQLQQGVPKKRSNIPTGGKGIKHIRALDFPYPAVATGEEWAPILHQKLAKKHGRITEVKVSGLRPEVTFSDGTVYVLDDYGIGYHGTGSYSFAAFLQAAGFKVSQQKVAKMKPPIILKHENARSVENKKENPTQAKSRFIDNGDGTVSDTLTGLQWQKEDDGIERNYEEAERYINELRLGGYNDWRLPRKEELMELAEVGYKALKRVFPNIKAERYWAKTSREELYWAQNPDKIAYTVDFDPSGNYGTDVTYFRSYEYYVRAVLSL